MNSKLLVNFSVIQKRQLGIVFIFLKLVNRKMFQSVKKNKIEFIY